MSSRINFFFTEALRSLSTNLATSVAATLSMLLALLVVGVFALMASFLILGARELANDAGKVNVFLQETATEDDVNALRVQLERMDEVEKVEFVSKEDALKRAHKMFKDNPGLLKNLPGNPFPRSLEADLRDPSKLELVSARMRGQKGVSEVKYGGEFVKKVIRNASLLTTIIAALGAGFTIAATMLVANTIRLSIFARRREIEVMKLVGASNLFVRLPFMIEGFLCGLIGAIGAIMVIALGWQMMSDIASKFAVGNAGVEVPVGMILLGLLGIGLLLGGFGSSLTIRKYLRV